MPPGVEIVINCMQMHRSEENYKNPAIFDPEHFLPEAVSQRHAFSYVPFSAGPRNCIGTRYANNVLRICTIYVTRNYKLRTNLTMDNLQFRMNITLNLLNANLITLEKRSQTI